ncbi:MAG: Uma2 family endonuclease, partial [Trichodesmium sp.]
TCDERDKKARKAIKYPCLIIEVLSPGTESVDRGKKFQNYRRISTLKEYVLVSANEIMLECLQLNEKGVWEFYSYQEGDNIELKNFNFSCPIDLIYEDVFLGE